MAQLTVIISYKWNDIIDIVPIISTNSYKWNDIVPIILLVIINPFMPVKDC